MLTEIQKNLLEKVSGLHKIPQGAVALRVNGKCSKISSTPEIIITKKRKAPGLNIKILPNTKQKSLHIPVILSESELSETVYNDFYIGENCDVLIVAGCGIHNSQSNSTSEHNGIHTFHIGKNSKVTYTENHLGLGVQNAEKNLSPITYLHLSENSEFIMETNQIGGVTKACRALSAELKSNAKLIIKETVLTANTETCESYFDIDLKGKNSACEVLSRVVAKNNSKQKFVSNIQGNNHCYGRVECDGIVLNSARVSSTPALSVNNPNATLSHEAQIGKIAGDELIKLMTLGLTQKQAESTIISAFLKG